MRAALLGGLLCASLALFAAPAVEAEPDPGDDPAGTVPLDEADRGRTRSLDSVDVGRTHSADSVDTGRTHSADSVDTGRTHSADSVDTGRTEALDRADRGETVALDTAEADRGWEPRPCSEQPVTLGGLPPGDDAEAWAAKLEAARREIDASKQRLSLADAAYARSLNFEVELGSERASIVRTRDAAREDYSAARCRLPALVERARQAGAPAEVFRPYL